MYARVNLEQAGQSQRSSSGSWSRAKRAFFRFRRPAERQRRARPADARRQDAVEHVHAALDHLEDALRVADAHEVARLLGGEERRGVRDGLEHRVAGLPHAEPAERVAVEVELDDLLDRAAPELCVGRALGDPEEELALGARRASRWRLRPERRQPDGFGEVVAVPAGAQTSRHIAMSEPSLRLDRGHATRA